ncbi:hypothetical protein K505DRAFT_368393 [Melanomma pulvis-pyrius CBS 109.77]|uniref:Uncharacterized protein n=1 Tax=Melanomma pulvis-pyrius CBS 109.77 TaxID=1314802 RepID=A0A6A6WQ98_9PLEO|nr:hypothetical protein K505DRAFT_368393 [Melanomma pulvis-pyrius CBS 109.77]
MGAPPRTRPPIPGHRRGLGGGAVPDEEYLFHDGGSNAQLVDADAAESLFEGIKDRFLRRLTDLTATRVAVQQDTSCDTFTVHLVGHMSEEHQKLLGVLEGALNCRSKNAPGCDELVQAEQQIRNTVFQWYTPRTKESITHIRTIFNQYKTVFDDLLSNLFGLNDDGSSTFDRELGDRVIELQSKTWMFVGAQIHHEEEETLVGLAHRICQLDGIQLRLKSLLGKTAFSTQLYAHICDLGSPERAVGTFTRVAYLFSRSNIANVRLVHVGAGSGEKKPPSTSDATRARPPPWTAEPSKRTKAFHAAVKPAQDPTSDFWLQAKQYLSPADQNSGLQWLQPKAKRDTLLLVGGLARRQNPHPNWDCYLDFGYVACTSPDEMQTLGGLYHAMLSDTARGLKPQAFENLWQALDRDALVALIESHEYLDALREALPQLELFLTVPRARRPSVWRLVQYLRVRDCTDEPGEALARDYGFAHCNRDREGIAALKQMYARVLERAAPLDLHEACVRGRLVEFAEEVGVQVGPRFRRLMQNPYGFQPRG